MKILFNFLLEGSLILAIGWVFFKLVLERLTFFDWNRTVLLSLLTMVLVLPFLSFKLNNPDSAMLEYTMPTFQVGQGVENQSGFTWQEALLGVYLIGLMVGLVKFSLGLAKPVFQLQLVEKYDYKGMKLAVHPSFEPASFFNYILLPKYDPEDPDQKQILLHESIHVSKKHTWDLILIQLCKAVFWFNPLVYSFEKSLREVHEFQADQGVTQSYSQIDYSRLLVKLIAQDQGWQLMNSFNQFQTKKRIVMMNKTKSTEMQKSRFLLVVPMLALMVFVFACEQNLEDEPIKPEQIVEVINEDGSTDLKGVVNGRVTEISADEIFDVVETQPVPPGGMEGWNSYLASTLNYPSQARQMGIEGTVIVVFVINTDGSLEDPQILRGVGAGCDEEAIRAIQNSPNWEPGKQRGREVRTRMRLPIRFKLS
jgi:TonB family protein